MASEMMANHQKAARDAASPGTTEADGATISAKDAAALNAATAPGTGVPTDVPSSSSSSSSSMPTSGTSLAQDPAVQQAPPPVDLAQIQAFLALNPGFLQPKPHPQPARNELGDSLEDVRKRLRTLQQEHRVDEQTLHALLRAPCDRMLGAPRLVAVEPEKQPAAVAKRLDDLFAAAKGVDAFKTTASEKEVKKMTVDEKAQRGVFVTIKELKAFYEEHTTDKESVAKTIVRVEDVARYLAKYADARVRYVLETKGSDAALAVSVDLHQWINLISDLVASWGLHQALAFEAAGRKESAHTGERLMQQQGSAMVRHVPGGRQTLRKRKAHDDSGGSEECCRQWNQGRCTFRNCNRLHECDLCGGGHKATACAKRSRYSSTRGYRGGMFNQHQGRYGPNAGQHSSGSFSGYYGGSRGGAGRGQSNN